MRSVASLAEDERHAAGLAGLDLQDEMQRSARVEPSTHAPREPFAVPTVPAVSQLTGPPERGNYGLVLSGQDRRTQFGSGDCLLINRGSRASGTAASD